MQTFKTNKEAVNYAIRALPSVGINDKIQWHKYNDTISARGFNISAPQYAIGNITRHGYGRFIVAKIDRVPLGDGYIACDVRGRPL